MNTNPTDPEFEAQVKREAARLREVIAENSRRRAEEEAERHTRVIQRVIKVYKQQLERDDPKSLCTCDSCLLGCASQQFARFCEKGQKIILANPHWRSHDGD